MKRWGMFAILAFVLCLTHHASAQEPLLQRGTKELSLSGFFDFENEGDALIDIRASYGFFPRDYLEVGGLVQIADDFDDTFRYELGGFVEYNFIHWAFLRMPRAVLYVGADLSLSFVDSDITEDNAALLFRWSPPAPFVTVAPYCRRDAPCTVRVDALETRRSRRASARGFPPYSPIPTASQTSRW